MGATSILLGTLAAEKPSCSCPQLALQGGTRHPWQAERGHLSRSWIARSLRVEWRGIRTLVAEASATMLVIGEGMALEHHEVPVPDVLKALKATGLRHCRLHAHLPTIGVPAAVVANQDLVQPPEPGPAVFVAESTHSRPSVERIALEQRSMPARLQRSWPLPPQIALEQPQSGRD